MITRLLFAGETLLLTLIVVVGVQTFVAQPYRVERESMLDTLQDGEMVLVDKLSPRLGGISRGDIVVFEPPARPGDDGSPFIKRVIGLPGDRVELRDGDVLVNGIVLDEPYVFIERGVRQPTNPTGGGASEWLVPQGGLLVMGDHRDSSAD